MDKYFGNVFKILNGMDYGNVFKILNFKSIIKFSIWMKYTFVQKRVYKHKQTFNKFLYMYCLSTKTFYIALKNKF